MRFLSFIKLYYTIIGWVLLIGFLLLAPADEFKKVHITIPHFDKVVHFGLFFILGFFIALKQIVKASNFHNYGLPVLAIIYGGIIEIIQWQFIYKRYGDWIDWIADIIGVLLGIWVISLFSKKVKQFIA